MFDVTKDVIDYFKEETRDEDEFQKIWAELVKWKTERDAEMKKQAEEERKRKEAQVKSAKLATLRENAATAVARYMVELFAGTSGEVTFDEVYNKTLENYKKSENAIDFLKTLERTLNDEPTAEKKKNTPNKNDDETLEAFLKKLNVSTAPKRDSYGGFMF